MDDRELAAAAAGGDQGAFTTIVERYRRYIYAIAYRIVLSEEDALDVTQDVFLLVARKIGDFDGRGPLKGWLATITARQALDSRQRSNRAGEPTEPQLLEDLAGARMEQDWDGAREGLEREQRRARVAAAMEQLSPQQRAIFTLKFREEIGPKEIARRLGLPAPQVRVQLTRAVARLREIVTREKC